MDFSNFWLPLLILAALGCCSEGGLLVTDKMNAVVGKYVTFKTTITSTQDFVTITWNFNKVEGITPIISNVLSSNTEDIDEKYTGRVIYNKTTCELQLGPLVKEDEGEYTLTAVTLKGKQLIGRIDLVVLEPVTDVKISSNVPEAVEFNSTVVLTCSAKGSFTYKWKNGSDPLVVDGTRVQLNAAGNVLNIAEVRRTDLRGPIFCIAENALESGTSAPFNLTVIYGPEKIIMTQTPTDSFLKKGSNLTLACSAQSDPPAQLKWMFNGGEMPLKTTSSITLTNLDETNSGNYSCVAYNAKTNRYISSPVAVVSVMEALSGTNISSSLSLLIAGVSAVNISCSAATGKAESVEWLKDNKPLVPGDRVILSADKKTLTIVKVVREDAGDYKCQLKNKVNLDESTYKMDIIYGPENVKVDGKRNVKFEELVKLTCSAESFPPSTYSWKHNGTSMNSSNAVITINKAKITNSGPYTCEALNPFTKIIKSTTHTLAVTEVGEVDKALSGGAIAGIVIGVLVVVLIIACIIKKKKKTGSII
ncbi:carcinoembryonic antigen-related cell adhesion molecule 1 isoform X2 [Carassius gibelio]|uniref:carcinoembryonic antigen-related cell adhesion molecule 1 isoform X1 n=1 Tax=Carassius gibelio TaxID=101364 RepID=UPI002279914E|nr:carcinoembryonic antigen-related cell adhesion molecule 1 isoform X1 [Carassius gibelio]XP_052388513.1 carcinoembryonic antigen-related cell adhesion molecule 1 isoform X2 [Carassius gibelio]